MEVAESAFNEKLQDSFADAFREVEDLGYPGATDPKLKVATRLRATDALDHEASVSYEIDSVGDDDATQIQALRLSEDNNGLGYQNLISMVFRLMAFRDAWMRVGKAGKGAAAEPIEPIHLVLIEEPEAHLHAQVQQVFIKKAYSVLRNRPELGNNTKLKTQLLVSTHSSHVAHEVPYASLRYFRRLPAGLIASVPVSTVVNLSETFGAGDETVRFVTRYLHAQHSDLFFADAAILVEGPAERMLLPNFIRDRYDFLNNCYISILEIGGSHAHRLKPLIAQLGLLTLVITDLDSVGTDGSATSPVRGAGQRTNNTTLREWVPAIGTIDELANATDDQKEWTQQIQVPASATGDPEYKDDPLFAVRAAYQTPLQAKRPGSDILEEALPYTFEDALGLENLATFAQMEGSGLVRKFRDAIENEPSIGAIAAKMFEALRSGKKAEFALDLLTNPSFSTLKIPTYIADGLLWLESRLRRKQVEALPRLQNSETAA